MPERRKVLFLVPSLGAGGAERVFSILLRHLDRSRFELHLGVLQGKGEYLEDLPDDVVLHDLSAARVRYALPSLVKLAWRVRPDTILSTLGHLNLALILIRPFMPRGIKLLIREAAIASVVLREEGRYPGLYTWLYRHLYKRAHRIVCLSDSMVSDMAEHFNVPREKLVRIYNPIDIKRVRAMAEIGENPYSGLGPHLVAAGRLTRQKGFDVLLNAMPYVLDRLPDARLSILGLGDLRQELVDQAIRLGIAEKVYFLGFQKNPWLYLRYADLFVLSSRYEGMPNIVLEALALGLPVVAADCPGALREMKDSVKRIVLVPGENPGALAEAIVEVCGETQRGREWRHSRQGIGMFDLQQVVGEYSKLLSG
ncbi:MAG TPA: glycosyltransferase [Candidatus Angelobacter sp.]